MKKCYIMRGIPYSGKSTKARELAGKDGKVHSTNDYFTVDGEYRYSIHQLREAHQFTLEEFKKSLEALTPVVVYDNCNIRVRDFQKAFELAESFGYEIEIVTIPHHIGLGGYLESNWRKIPQDKFVRMWESFEKFDLPVLTPT